MMVELMNWYVMVSCHVMLQKTPALVSPAPFQRQYGAVAMVRRFLSVSHATAASDEI
jgi:hypothetical protein